MKGKRFSEERIVTILKEAECKTSTVQEICRKHGVSEQSFYRWRKKYGGLSVSETKRLKELEKEKRPTQATACRAGSGTRCREGAVGKKLVKAAQRREAVDHAASRGLSVRRGAAPGEAAAVELLLSGSSSR